MEAVGWQSVITDAAEIDDVVRWLETAPLDTMDTKTVDQYANLLFCRWFDAPAAGLWKSTARSSSKVVSISSLSFMKHLAEGMFLDHLKCYMYLS